MARRASSLANPSVAVQSKINTEYDKVEIVADSITDVQAVSANISAVVATASNNADVSTVASISNEVVSVANDKATLDSIYADKATLDSIFADKATLDSLYADKITLDSIYADKITLDSIYADKATLDSIYADKSALDSLYTDKATLDRIYASITNIDRVFSSADNIDIVRASIGNVDIAATNVADINKYANTYVGPSATEPTVRSDGSALQSGDLYYDTVIGEMKSYNGTVWNRAYNIDFTTDILTLTNKTIIDPSNTVNANALHYTFKASGAIAKGDCIVAQTSLGDGITVAATQTSLTQVVIGIAVADVADTAIGVALTTGTYDGYDSTGLVEGDILYPDGLGGLTNTPTILDGNVNQPIALVANINGTSANLVINIHSSHEGANLISYDPATSRLTKTNVQEAIKEVADFSIKKSSDTSSAQIPVGDSSQRDAAPIDGMIRYNNETLGYEGYNNGSWASLGGGATGTGTDRVFSLNDQVVTNNFTIPSGQNAHSAGTITIGKPPINVDGTAGLVGTSTELTVTIDSAVYPQGHEVVVGDSVTIAGSTSYDGQYIVDSVTSAYVYVILGTTFVVGTETVGTTVKDVTVTISDGSSWSIT